MKDIIDDILQTLESIKNREIRIGELRDDTFVDTLCTERYENCLKKKVIRYSLFGDFQYVLEVHYRNNEKEVWNNLNKFFEVIKNEILRLDYLKNLDKNEVYNLEITIDPNVSRTTIAINDQIISVPESYDLPFYARLSYFKPISGEERVDIHILYVETIPE